MKTKARTRPDRNEIARRVTLREGGAKQVDLGQVKDVVARYWDEVATMPTEDVVELVHAEIVAAGKRFKRKNLS